MCVSCKVFWRLSARLTVSTVVHKGEEEHTLVLARLKGHAPVPPSEGGCLLGRDSLSLYCRRGRHGPVPDAPTPVTVGHVGVIDDDRSGSTTTGQ